MTIFLQQLPAWLALIVNFVLVVIYIINTKRKNEEIKILKETLDATHNLLKSSNESVKSASDWNQMFDVAKVKEYIAIKEELIIMEQNKTNNQVLINLQEKINTMAEEVNQKFEDSFRAIAQTIHGSSNVLVGNNYSGKSQTYIDFLNERKKAGEKTYMVEEPESFLNPKITKYIDDIIIHFRDTEYDTSIANADNNKVDDSKVGD